MCIKIRPAVTFISNGKRHEVIYPLAQARAPPLGNCASGSVNLLPFLTAKIAIMVCLYLLSVTVFGCQCAVSRLTRLHLCLFAYHPAAEIRIVSSNLAMYESSFLLSFAVNTVLLVFNVDIHTVLCSSLLVTQLLYICSCCHFLCHAPLNPPTTRIRC